MSTPSRTPDLHRSFQLTDFARNSNKYWEIEAWDLGGHWVQRTKFGRTGRGTQVHTKDTTHRRIQTLIRRKKDKGYTEVDLATIEQADGDTIAETGDEKVDWFVRTMFEEADGYIKSYLRVKVDQLSRKQLAAGRELLWKIGQSWHASPGLIDYPLVNLCQEYYMTIPTQLPHRIDTEDVVKSLVNDLHEQEERLDQLAVAVRQADQATGGQLLTTPAQIERAKDDVGWVTDLFNATFETTHRSRGISGNVREVFKVHIPSEHEAYDAELTSNDVALWHGTNARNLRHIMETGLIIPSHAANGSMLGRGIYFADKSSKSAQYTRGNKMRVMLLADVKIGKPWEAPKADSKLNQPPAGFDSVLGRAGVTNTWSSYQYLAYNEYVVYRASQQTIRYAVVLD